MVLCEFENIEPDISICYNCEYGELTPFLCQPYTESTCNITAENACSKIDSDLLLYICHIMCYAFHNVTS